MLRTSSRFFLLLCLSLLVASCATNFAERKSQAESFRRVGEGFLAEGDATAALKELLKAERLNHRDALLQNDLGLAYFAKKKFDLAVVHFKKALEFKPDYSEALNNMGTVYLRLEKRDEAIACFKRALDNLLYTTPHFALNNLGESYRGKNDYSLAIDFYKQALETNPRFPEAHRGLGLTYIATGNYKAAVSFLEKAVQYAPSFAVAYYDLGRARALRNNPEKAIASFKKVCELVPDSPLADRALAEIGKLKE